MNTKKIILCPNPNRDHGMTTTKAAEKILHELGFRTVVCSPFRDQKEGAFADYDVPNPNFFSNRIQVFYEFQFFFIRISN